MLMLRRALNSRIGHTGLETGYVIKLWSAAIAGAAAAWLVKFFLPGMYPVLTAMLVLGPYGVIFLATTFLLRIPEASAAFKRLRR